MAYLRNKKDFDTLLLLSQSLSCKAYKTYIADIYFKIVQKLKIYDVHLRLRLMLQTKVILYL